MAEGLRYASQNFKCNSVTDIWYQLQDVLTYQSDPDRTNSETGHDEELFHSLDSLMNDNYHGVPGAGDCDDMAIATATVALANGLDCVLVYVGNDRRAPSHIYCEVDGVPVDFTCPALGHTRRYKFITKQRIIP